MNWKLLISPPVGGLGSTSKETLVDIQVIEKQEEETKGEEKDTPSDSNPPQAKTQPLPPPFIVEEGLPAIPPKLVAKIQRGEFVDMAELLRNNIEADRREAATAGNVVATLLASTKPRREVLDLMSWVQCFGMCASVLGEAYSNLRKGLRAYQTFIVREARRSSGWGWQEYDSMFRQQQASASDLKWDSCSIRSYLCSSTLLTSRKKSC